MAQQAGQPQQVPGMNPQLLQQLQAGYHGIPGGGPAPQMPIPGGGFAPDTGFGGGGGWQAMGGPGRGGWQTMPGRQGAQIPTPQGGFAPDKGFQQMYRSQAAQGKLQGMPKQRQQEKLKAQAR